MILSIPDVEIEAIQTNEIGISVNMITIKYLILLLLCGCATIKPKYPSEFESTASKQKLKKVLEWGSISRIDGGSFVFDKIKIEWSKGDVSTSGFKFGKFGKQGKDHTQPFSFSLKFQDGLLALVNCETEMRARGQGYGVVWSATEERRIICHVRQGTQNFKLQLKSPQALNYSGELIGNGLEIQVRPNKVDNQGKEYGAPLSWDILNKNRLIASLGSGFEPDYMFVNNDKRLLLLATAIAGAIVLAIDVH